MYITKWFPPQYAHTYSTLRAHVLVRPKKYMVHITPLAIYFKADEIKQVFRESGVDLDDDEVAELIEEADENKDGVISFEGKLYFFYKITGF